MNGQENGLSISATLHAAQIAHILFLDLVSFSTLPLGEQGRALERVRAAVDGAETVRAARARGALLVLPTGDGMALVFHDDLSAPARAALEIAGSLRQSPPVAARIGIHSGLVQPHLDLGGRENLVGEGINTAHRVMECADGGHILVSGEHARWLRALEGWDGRLTEVGTATVKHGLKIELFALADPATGLGRNDPPAAICGSSPGSEAAADGENGDPPIDVVLLYRRNAKPDEELLAVLEEELSARGLSVYRDRSARPGGVEAQREQERRLRAARAVLPILSPRALRSEMLQYALEAALDERQARGGPAILPVQIGRPEPDEDDDLAIRDLVAPFPHLQWDGPEDNPRLVAEVVSALREPVKPRDVPLEVVGGGMSPDSPFYVERAADAEFHALLERRHSIVLVRGGRQIGKTSLLAQGLKRARERGARTVRTDFQKLSGASLSDAAIFYRQLAASVARQLAFAYDFALLWDAEGDPGQNFEYFLRDLLEAEDAPLVWFLDEADKMFSAPFSADFFGLVRSWHNDRAAEPDGPLHRLTVVIAYATEAHLFISDLNQSPFNVGERVSLDDFTPEQALRLNDLYGGPVRTREEMERLHDLLGGQPYLTRRTLDAVAREKETVETLLRDAARDDGPFADHLKRVLASVSALESVTEYVRAVLAGGASLSADHQDAFYRLLRAGIVRQDRDGRVVFRCDLYRQYLREHLTGGD